MAIEGVPRRGGARGTVRIGEEPDVVWIRPGGSELMYSAGARTPEPKPGDTQREFPPWPEGQELSRRRETR